MGRNEIMAEIQAKAAAAADAAVDPLFAYDAPFSQIDGAAIAAVTDLYREMLPSGGAILDVMSGWVPHLPPEAPYRRVVGIGIERRALAENPFLDDWRVQDLNANPMLPFAAAEFDGATICAAVQYLARPTEVMRDIARVLRPGAPLSSPFQTDVWRRRRSPAGVCMTRRGSCALSRSISPRPATGPMFAASIVPRPAAVSRYTPS